MMEPKMRIVIDIGNYLYRGAIFKIDEKKLVLENCSRILRFKTLQDTIEDNIVEEECFGGKVTFFIDKINLVFTPNWA